MAPRSGTCPLCLREGVGLSDHHLVPRCRGGDETATVCIDCHNAIHAQFTNKQLETEYDSVDKLMANERFAATVRFIGKQHGRVKTVRSRDQRRRGRNG